MCLPQDQLPGVFLVYHSPMLNPDYSNHLFRKKDSLLPFQVPFYCFGFTNASVIKENIRESNY